jgi:ubiquitin-like modifier-activating enzyme ATG7
MPLLQFSPFSSAIDAPFFVKLSQVKINEYKLSQELIPIYASYSSALFSPTFANTNSSYFGYLLNVNTIEEFKEFIKSFNNTDNTLIAKVVREVQESISDGSAVKNPGLCNKFCIVSFCNLKTYKYF